MTICHFLMSVLTIFVVLFWLHDANRGCRAAVSSIDRENYAHLRVSIPAVFKLFGRDATKLSQRLVPVRGPATILYALWLAFLLMAAGVFGTGLMLDQIRFSPEFEFLRNQVFAGEPSIHIDITTLVSIVPFLAVGNWYFTSYLLTLSSKTTFLKSMFLGICNLLFALAMSSLVAYYVFFSMKTAFQVAVAQGATFPEDVSFQFRNHLLYLVQLRSPEAITLSCALAPSVIQILYLFRTTAIAAIGFSWNMLLFTADWMKVHSGNVTDRRWRICLLAAASSLVVLSLC